FARPGDWKMLNCKGRPCSKCHKCRDWHYSGDQNTWNWICNWRNWSDGDCKRYNNSNIYKLFTKRDGAACGGAGPDVRY
ncbi:unnamed protein product, partial [Rotaria magnacalcarata]